MKHFRTSLCAVRLVGAFMACVPFQEAAATLGDYVACEVDNFTFSETTVETSVVETGPVDAGSLGAAKQITGTGTGRCSQDYGGMSGWVSSTFTFSGKVVNDACVLSTDAGVHTARGTFGLSDGSPRGTVPATLIIAAKPIDAWRRLVDVSITLEDSPLVTSFRVVDANPPLMPDERPQACPRTSQHLPQSCDAVTYFSLPTNPRTFDFIAPVGLPGVSGCRDWIQVVGDIEAVHPSEDGEAVLDDSSGLLELLNLTNAETGIEEMLPEGYRPGLGGGNLGTVIDVNIQLALEQMFSTLEEMFTVSPTSPPQLATPSTPVPFTIKVRYHTALGYQTISQVGVPGVPNAVLIPNENNSNIPEPVQVTLTTVAGANTGDADYTLVVERTPTSTCRQLRADVSIVEPAEELANVVGGLATLGFETLDIPSGAMPARFELKMSRSSTDTEKNNAVRMRTAPACGSYSPLDFVGKYQVSGELTNLMVRMPMRPVVATLDLIATNTKKGFRFNYQASGFVDGILLTGTRSGTPVDLSLTEIPRLMDLCSDKGNACATPWRATVGKSCTVVGWERVGDKWHEIRPVYECKAVPRDLNTSMWFTSRAGAYPWPVTLSAKFYGAGSSNPNMTVTNLKFSDFAFDARTNTYPKHGYWDTRSQNISGKIGVPGTASFTANFWARDRQLVVKKVKWYEGFYKLNRSGKMHCNSGFKIDFDGVPGMVEDWIEDYICN